MSFVRPVSRAVGLGVRGIHTSRVSAVQASKVARHGAISPEETGGFKYTPDNAILKGTVNDATQFPEIGNPSHGSYHWAFERVIAASLIPLAVSAAVVSPTAHPIVDGVLGITLIAHTHMGFTSCIDDYVHERKFGALGHAARWLLRFATAGAVLGVYEFNTNDIGLTELVEKVWKA